jgi:hypothetical protein
MAGPKRTGPRRAGPKRAVPRRLGQVQNLLEKKFLLDIFKNHLDFVL